MAAYTFTFNGVSSTTHLMVSGRPHWDSGAPVDTARQNVPGRAGSYVVGHALGERAVTFTVGVGEDDDTDSEVQARLHAIAAWLTTSAPKALVLSDDPNVAYNAKLDGSMVPANIANYRQFDITFIIPDPYAYSPTETETALVVGENAVTNSGGVDAFPRYVVELSGPTNAIRVESTSGYVQVGQPADETQTGTDPEPLSFHDDCSDTSGWGAGTCADYGVVAGVMASNGSSLSPRNTGGSFGDPTEDWHGPTLGRDLTANLDDFKVEAWVAMDNRNVNGMGRIEVYLLDVSDNVIGKMQIRDSWASMAKVEAFFCAGDAAGTHHDLLTTTGHTAVSLNNFYGLLRISREMTTVTFTDEATTANVAKTRYAITDTAKDSWPFSDPTVVKVDGTVVTTGYTIEYASGTVVFGSALTTEVVTVSGKYRVDGSDLWTAYIARCDSTTRVANWRTTRTWVDAAGTYAADLHHVEIRVAGYHDNARTTTCLFDEVNVTGVTGGILATDPVVIGVDGDVFEIDSYDAVVRKNGEPYMAAVDLGSAFFPIGAGSTTVSLDVDGSVQSASAFVRERWM